jgi:hypothetical protein
MSSIGDFEFDQWQGFMPRATRVIDRLPNFPGIDGCTMLAGAWQVAPAQIRTAYLVDTLTDADQTIDAFRALMMDDELQGQSVTDSLGFTYDNVTVVAVNSSASMLIDGTYRIDSAWILQCQADEPGS